MAVRESLTMGDLVRRYQDILKAIQDEEGDL